MALTKASITFGLVYIPVKLELAVKNNDISFNQLHKRTKERIRYKKTCPSCEGEVSPGDIVKGYEYESGKYVIIDDDEFEKLKTPRDRSIVIESFVNAKDIDPIYYGKTYYIHPDKATKPLALLVSAMSDNKVAIARTVMSYKQNLVALRIKDKALTMSLLYYYDEIVAPPIYPTEKLTKNEQELAKTLIASMSGKFEPKNYKDEYQEKLRAAINMKIRGKEIVATPTAKDESAPIDLVAALQQSLKNAGAVYKN